MSRKPLIEVAFEIRFQPRNNLATELLLEAHNEFKGALKVLNSEGSKIPEEIKVEQTELYYVPSYKVVYEDFSLLISDGSLVVLKNFITGQYEGWEHFKPRILQLIHILKNRNKISEVQRYSLKYTNLFNEEFLGSDEIEFDISLGKNKFGLKDNFELKTESIDQSHVTMLKASSQVGVINTCDVKGIKTRIQGFLLIIDLINNVDSLEISNIDRDLEELHARAYKEFRNIYPDNKRII